MITSGHDVQLNKAPGTPEKQSQTNILSMFLYVIFILNAMETGTFLYKYSRNRKLLFCLGLTEILNVGGGLGMRNSYNFILTATDTTALY